jgi:RNA polymerase sigma-70 factor (ECF subfamily)
VSTQVERSYSAHFFKLAVLEIRRELIDLGRHHLGTQGQGAKHHTGGAGRAGGSIEGQAAESGEPTSLEDWTTFHECVGALPDEEREVFGLIYYDGLLQEEAATELGISLRTVKRRWQSARITLHRAMSVERQQKKRDDR